MGVITRMLYQGQDLSLVAYNHLFLDMEENIHIHYRDLRIELSKDEFLEISHTFAKQSQELQSIIADKNYKDGVLPNSNQEDVRIWTDSKLKTPVSYHPQRISIEECTDGYHLHLRNYKLLFNHDDFKALLQAMKSIDLNKHYAKTASELIQLFKDNELDFEVLNPQQIFNTNHTTIKLQVAHYHLSKIRNICKRLSIGEQFKNGQYIFSNALMCLSVVSQSSQEFLYQSTTSRPEQANTTSLTTFISNQEQANFDTINYIKSQVLELFELVKNQEKTPDVDLNYRHWTYDSALSKVNFPFKLADKELSSSEANTLYRDWSAFLQSYNLYFVKPQKQVFEEPLQSQTVHNALTEIIDTIAIEAAVSKIYLMGSITRNSMGLYLKPFIHSRWAKLGSDVDILIEMSEENSPIPRQWKYINRSNSNSCDIYHLSQLLLEDKFGFQKQFPHIKFFHHLIDAYIYIPNKSNNDKKNTFLDKFSAKLLYSSNPDDILDIEFQKSESDIEDPWANAAEQVDDKQIYNKGLNNKERDEQKLLNNLSSELNSQYSLDISNLSIMPDATENGLYSFKDEGSSYIVKIFKVAGNYHSKRIIEHAEYEAALLNVLDLEQVNFALIIRAKNSKRVIFLESEPSQPIIIYAYELGKVYKYPDPDYPIKAVTRSLSAFHGQQIQSPLKLDKSFTFNDVFALWHPEFYRFKNEVTDDDRLTEQFNQIEFLYHQHKQKYEEIISNNNIIWLHNHGDITPKNFVIKNSKAILIDFQNAFYGPRLFDIIDGAYEFSFSGKLVAKEDFNRFDEFIGSYQYYAQLKNVALNSDELTLLDDAIIVCGIIKFIKEVRMIKGASNKNNLRRSRALSLGNFLINKYL